MSFLTDPPLPSSNRHHNHHFTNQHYSNNHYINSKSNSLQSKSIQTPLQSLNVLLGRTTQKLSSHSVNQNNLSQENSIKSMFSPAFYSHSSQQQQQQPCMQEQFLLTATQKPTGTATTTTQHQQQQVPCFRSFQTRNSTTLCKKKLETAVDGSNTNTFVVNQDFREPKYQSKLNNSQNHNTISGIRFSACNSQQLTHEFKGKQQPQSVQVRRSVDNQSMQQPSSSSSSKVSDKTQQQIQQLQPQYSLEQKVEKKRYALHLDEDLVTAAVPTLKKPNTTMNITSTGSDLSFKSAQFNCYPNNQQVQRNKQFSLEKKQELTTGSSNSNNNPIKTSIVSLFNNQSESQNSSNANTNTLNKKLHFRQETSISSYPNTQHPPPAAALGHVIPPSPQQMPSQADFPKYLSPDSNKKSSQITQQLTSPCNSKQSNEVFSFPPQPRPPSLQSKNPSNINRSGFLSPQTATTAAAAAAPGCGVTTANQLDPISFKEKYAFEPQINCFMLKAPELAGNDNQQIVSQQQQQPLHEQQYNNQINRKKSPPIFQADTEDRSSQANNQAPLYTTFKYSQTSEEQEYKQQPQKQQLQQATKPSGFPICTTFQGEQRGENRRLSIVSKLQADDDSKYPSTSLNPSVPRSCQSARNSSAKQPLLLLQQQQQQQQQQAQQQFLIADAFDAIQQNDHTCSASQNQNISVNFSKNSYPTYTLQTFDQLESSQLSSQFCFPMTNRNQENDSIQIAEMSVQIAPKSTTQRILPQQTNEICSAPMFESHNTNPSISRNLISRGCSNDNQVVVFPSSKSSNNQEFQQLFHPAMTVNDRQPLVVHHSSSANEQECNPHKEESKNHCNNIGYHKDNNQTPLSTKNSSKKHAMSQQQQQAPSVSYLAQQASCQSCEFTTKESSNCIKQPNIMQKHFMCNNIHTSSTSATTGSQQDSQIAVSYEGDKNQTLGFTTPSTLSAADPYATSHNQSQQQQKQQSKFVLPVPPPSHHAHSQRLSQSSCCQFPITFRPSNPQTSTNTPSFPHNSSLSLCYSNTGSPSPKISNPPNSPKAIFSSSSEQASTIPSKPTIATPPTPKASVIKPMQNKDQIIQIDTSNRRNTTAIWKKEETPMNKRPSSQQQQNNTNGIQCLPSPKPNTIQITGSTGDNPVSLSNIQLKTQKNEHNERQTISKQSSNQFQSQQHQQQQQQQPQQYLSIDNYEILKLLGRGVFGRVYMVRDKLTRGVLALKVIEKQLIQQKRMLPQLNRELDIHRFIGTHPNILECLNSFEDQNCYYLLMEFVADGTIADLLQQSPTRRLSETQAATIVKHVLLALHHLHAKQVIHRDLKLENILLSNGVAKLCDFGCATYGDYNDEQYPQRRSFCGTIDYVSPEMISDQIYDKEIDVWAIGVIAFELASGCSPFTHSTEQLTYTAIKNGQFKCPSYFSSKLCDFLRRILVIDRKKRAKVDEMLNHPWITELSMNYLVS